MDKKPNINAAPFYPSFKEEKLDNFAEMNNALIEEYFAGKKDRLNVVFIGHVDAGKSTMGGNILYLTGMVDQRTMEKYMNDAREAGRESWYLSWALDTTDEERGRGKTVETGRAFFETELRKYTILDAPGHKNYVPSMIQGAQQADVAILVISARKGEFETGFEYGGQTREHAILVKSSGVKKLIVAINKMDDPTVNWSRERYEECKDRLVPFLRKECNYNIKNDVIFVPVSGFSGANLCQRFPSFYDGPSLIEILDNLPIDHSLANQELCIPISEKYTDMGLIICGKIESGIIKKNQAIVIMPMKLTAEVTKIFIDNDEVEAAQFGDSVNLKIKGCSEEEIVSGSVVSCLNTSLNAVLEFDAQILVLNTEKIISAGYEAVMHIHHAIEDIVISKLLRNVDKKTGKPLKSRPDFVKNGDIFIGRIQCSHPVCLDTFKNKPQLSRFTLRLNTNTVAIGKVLKINQT